MVIIEDVGDVDCYIHVILHQVSKAEVPTKFDHPRLVQCSHTLILPLVLTPRVPPNQH